MEIGIIGLGKFGFFLGSSLVDMGHRVIGVDSDPAKVQAAQETLTQVYTANASDSIALEQLGIADLAQVVVSVGQSMEASILIALHLKELGAKDVWVKAVSEDHEKILKRIGIKHVIFPERVAAEELARKLVDPGFLDSLSLGKDVVLRELEVDKWAGKNLIELNLTNTLKIQVVAVKRVGKREPDFIPDARRPLNKGELLVVLGKDEDIAKAEA
ncbi:potassium channel family protein [Desulfoplanes formicivorans]|uniref:Potassium transporter TrkA n=1 Tax=Desulfoplanes formicivorans TaxID=1592317 RepID=A0A194AK57_9BACT|nr:TrkA family potassium uptake protein [Desulfoplanes formicivorans]GAU09441.1 potassium transporter TrkA [Desulfoplanes formicivorans]